MPNENASGLSAVVASIKLIARNVLRMRLISARQSKISLLEGDDKAQDARVVAAEKDLAEAKVDLAEAEFDKTQLNPKHPKAAAQLEKADKVIEARKADVTASEAFLATVKAEVKTAKEQIAKDIKEQNDGIAKIESGETKVCKEDLNDTVEKLITEHGREQVRSL